jgi:hypothetical protein
MQTYPYFSPIILNDTVFSLYGGQGTGTFPSMVLQSSYLLAEMQVTNYIGTFLLPTTVTGTYAYTNQKRLATDYGYVQQLLNVNILTKTGCNTCNLQNNDGCGFIYNDTFGYVDFSFVTSVCGQGWWGYPYAPYIAAPYPYQIQISYIAGLPTGTASQPGFMEALTILAQVDLNEKFPGAVGINESVGAVGIQEFKSMDYFEKRAEHALVKTALGDDARSQRAKKLLDMSIRKARRVLFA